MAGATQTVVLDDAAFTRMERRLLAKLRDARPILKEIGEEALIQTEARFEAEKDPEGNRWKPLAWSTLYGSFSGRKTLKRGAAKGRASVGFARYVAYRKILTRRGMLRGTIRYRVGAGFVEVGTDKVYGATHQFGRDSIPARPYLGISQENKQAFIDIVKRHIVESL